MDPKAIDLYNEYNKGTMDRREFIKKLSAIAGSAAAVSVLLSQLENNSAIADVIPKDDPRLQTENVAYPGETGDIIAYQARLKGNEKLPGVIVIHENRGLNDHIKDVVRRVALEGYISVAPDALSQFGGTPEDPNEGQALIGQLDVQSTRKNFVAAVAYLKTHPQSTGKVGVVGFCWGGEMANQVAVNSPDLNAAVPFYGRQPAANDVPKIKASLLLHYGGLDAGINAGIPAYEEALKAASIDYRIYMYEGANHAFFNDTNAARYHEESAELAWERTVLFLEEKLKDQSSSVSSKGKVAKPWGGIK